MWGGRVGGVTLCSIISKVQKCPFFPSPINAFYSCFFPSFPFPFLPSVSRCWQSSREAKRCCPAKPWRQQNSYALLTFFFFLLRPIFHSLSLRPFLSLSVFPLPPPATRASSAGGSAATHSSLFFIAGLCSRGLPVSVIRIWGLSWLTCILSLLAQNCFHCWHDLPLRLSPLRGRDTEGATGPLPANRVGNVPERGGGRGRLKQQQIDR